MEKFAFSLGIIFLGLTSGYVFQVLVEKGTIQLAVGLEGLRKILQKIALLFFNPVAFLGAVWIVKLDDMRIAVLPFIGIAALVLGGVLAFLFARFLNLDRKQTGAYIVSGGFTNIGSMGALLCFMFLGEPAFALVPFYKLFEEFSYYAIGFPMAKSFSSAVAETNTLAKRTKKVFTDVFVLAALGSMAVGFALNISGVRRPDFYQTINAFFIPAAAMLLLSSIGMAMRFSSIGKYFKASSLIVLIKFGIVPLAAGSLAYLLGLGQVEDGLPLKVVLILSSMPVGFIAMVPPTIYDLDVDLANSNWLVTNGLLIIIIPVLFFIISYI